jgi:hypothetical protein
MPIAAFSLSLKEGFFIRLLLLLLFLGRTVLRTFLMQWQRDVASDFILF